MFFYLIFYIFPPLPFTIFLLFFSIFPFFLASLFPVCQQIIPSEKRQGILCPLPPAVTPLRPMDILLMKFGVIRLYPCYLCSAILFACYSVFVPLVNVCIFSLFFKVPWIVHLMIFVDLMEA